MLTMMVGANVTSSQLVSIAERMLLETDLDQVTLKILFGLGGSLSSLFSMNIRRAPNGL